MKILDRSMVAGLALAQSVACSSAVVTLRAPNADISRAELSVSSVRYAELLEINRVTQQKLERTGVDWRSECSSDSKNLKTEIEPKDSYLEPENRADAYSPRALSSAGAAELSCELLERYNECLKSLLQGK